MLKDVFSALPAENFEIFENFRSTLQHVASLRGKMAEINKSVEPVA